MEYLRTVRINRDSFRLLVAVLACTGLGLVYLEGVALPFLRGESTIAAVGGDSFLYQEWGKFGEFPSDPMVSDKPYVRVGLLSTYGITALGKVAAAFSEAYYEYVIFCFNTILLLLTLRNWQLIFAHYGSDRYDQFLVLFLVNPVWLASLASLNKEIWAIFAVSSFIRNLIYESRIRFLIVALICSAIRDVLGFIGLVFLLMNSVKVTKSLYLIGVSVLYSFTLREIVVMNTAADIGARSADLMQVLADIEAHPLGYVLTYVPKLLINLYAAMAPHHFAELSWAEPYAMMMTVSSVLFFLCSLVLGRKVVATGRLPESNMVDMFFAYTLIACLVPYSQHRLFVPVYATLPAAILLSYPRRSERAKDYARVVGTGLGSEPIS